jgi:hypothetical protein
MITKFTDDLNIIRSLPVTPTPNGGYTAESLMAKWDEAGLKTQSYLNNTLVPEIDAHFTTVDGSIDDMKTKLNNIVIGSNAEEIGAKLNNIVIFSDGTNASSLLQSNTTVRVPVGSFAVDIVMPDNSILEGYGDSSWIQGSITIGSNCIVRNLKIGYDNKPTLFQNGANNSKIINCTLTKGDSYGALYANDVKATNILFDRCIFDGATANGVKFVDKGTSSKHLENIEFHQCIFRNNNRMNFEIILRQDGTNNIVTGYRNINLIDCVFNGRTSLYSGQDTYINVSYDSNMLTDGSNFAGGYSTIKGCTFNDGMYVLEMAGAIKMNIHNNSINGGVTKCISTSQINNYSNKTLFTDNYISTSAEAQFQGKDNIITGNIFNCGARIVMNNCSNNEFSSNNCVCLGAAVLDLESSYENRIVNNVLDNSANTANSAPIRFLYAASINNVVYNNRIVKGTGGVYISEQSSASGNKNYNNFSNKGYMRIAGQDNEKTSRRISGAGNFIYMFTNLNTTGQSYLHVKIKWVGRLNNGPAGGEITVLFGTYDSKTASPTIIQSGTAVTLTTGTDGSGNPTFTIASAASSVSDYIGEVELMGTNLAGWGF